MNASRKTILIVDDDNDDIELFQLALKRNRCYYNFHSANNGTELFNLLQTISPPDLIILDINMPGLSGFECLQKLKANIATETIPVVMMSTALHEQAQRKCLSLGATAYLSKPSSLKTLQELVAALCAKYLPQTDSR